MLLQRDLQLDSLPVSSPEWLQHKVLVFGTTQSDLIGRCTVCVQFKFRTDLIVGFSTDKDY